MGMRREREGEGVERGEGQMEGGRGGRRMRG